MKNLLLTLILCSAMGLSNISNAAVISIDFGGQTQYDINDTIYGQLLVSNFDDTLGAFFAELNYQPINLALINWQFGNGFDDGFGSYQFNNHNHAVGTLNLEDYSDFSADVDILNANQGNEFILASFSFQALNTGQHTLSLNAQNTGLIDFDNNDVNAQFSNGSFNVSRQAHVSEPTSMLIFIGALALLMVNRQRMA